MKLLPTDAERAKQDQAAMLDDVRARVDRGELSSVVVFLDVRGTGDYEVLISGTTNKLETIAKLEIAKWQIVERDWGRAP